MANCNRCIYMKICSYKKQYTDLEQKISALIESEEINPDNVYMVPYIECSKFETVADSELLNKIKEYMENDVRSTGGLYNELNKGERSK